MRITLRRGAAAGVYGLGHGAPASCAPATKKRFRRAETSPEPRLATEPVRAISIGNHFHTAMSCRSEQVLARLCWQLVAIASHASTPSGASRVPIGPQDACAAVFRCLNFAPEVPWSAEGDFQMHRLFVAAGSTEAHRQCVATGYSPATSLSASPPT